MYNDCFHTVAYLLNISSNKDAVYIYQPKLSKHNMGKMTYGKK